jgi:hypothetical protein
MDTIAMCAGAGLAPALNFGTQGTPYHHEVEFGLIHKANFSYISSPKKRILIKQIQDRPVDPDDWPVARKQFPWNRGDRGTRGSDFLRPYHSRKRPSLFADLNK